ncbi:Rap/ran-GAP protein [Apophysomyces sp. BC1021]|nr:Rap/ran-GAP protein [Apophysomyces sp. BC1021]
MTHPPSVTECCGWIAEHCTAALDSLDDPEKSDCAIKKDVTIALDSIQVLLGALDAPQTEIVQLKDRLRKLRQTSVELQTPLCDKDKNSRRNGFKKVIQCVLDLCTICKIPKAMSYVHPGDYKTESPKILPRRSGPSQYQSMWPEHIDSKASWFRRHFVGKGYVNLIGPLRSATNTRAKQPALSDDGSYGIISVVRERAKDFCGPGNGAAAVLGSQYRIIIRGREVTVSDTKVDTLLMHGGSKSTNWRHVIHETMAKETLAYLDTVGQSQYLDHSPLEQRRGRTFRNASIDNNASKLMRAAVLAAHPGLDLRNFKELSAEVTIMTGLEKELLRFDEIGIPQRYKFGVINIQDGQATEEEWFANTGLSAPLERFLNILGTRVNLRGYMGYAAGLDTKSGESGETSYVSRWREQDIMFHVTPLMPFRDHDRQQVHRKRHIGNDIVCVVFIEGNQHFDPKAIRSQFLHIFVVVHPEVVNGRDCWRVEVVRHKNVIEFGPPLPSPALFFDEDELGEYLRIKLVNGDNAALKSDKFSVPNIKARKGILKNLVETGLTSPTSMNRTLSTTRLARNSSVLGRQQRPDGIERPKSAGAQRTSRSSIRNFSAGSPPRSMTPDTPPIPTPSRSTLLQDLKSFAKRRSSGMPPRKETSSKLGPLEDLSERVYEHTVPKITNGNEGVGRFSSDKQHEEEPGSERSPQLEPNLSSRPIPSSPDGIRSRAQNLMSSVMNRRPRGASSAGDKPYLGGPVPQML